MFPGFSPYSYDAEDVAKATKENKLVCRTCKKDLRGLLPEGVDREFTPRCGPTCFPGDDGRRIDVAPRIAVRR